MVGSGQGSTMLEGPRIFPVPPLMAPSPSLPESPIFLPGAGDYGDAAHQHQRGGGTCPSPWCWAGSHVLCSRIPDAGPLHHHDPEGQSSFLQFLFDIRLFPDQGRRGAKLKKKKKKCFPHSFYFQTLDFSQTKGGSRSNNNNKNEAPTRSGGTSGDLPSSSSSSC